MAEIIRERPIATLNILNQWPSNGLFSVRPTAHHSLKRKWLNIVMDDIAPLIGNVFEQAEYTTIVFKITLNVHRQSLSDSQLELSIEDVGDIAVPIEAFEYHALQEYLKMRIKNETADNGPLTVMLHCYVKGWFW